MEDYALRANQSTLDTEKRALLQLHMFYRAVYGLLAHGLSPNSIQNRCPVTDQGG